VVKIRDNDLLTISTVKFIDNRDLLSDTSGTFDTNWKNATQHWTASDPTATLPVCYACTDSMSCKITVAGNYDANRTFLVRMKWTYNLGDDQSCAYSSWTNLTTDTTVLLPFTFHTYFAQQRAYYDLDSTLSWEFKTANDGEDRGEDGDMGESQHPLYITYSAPVSGAEMYHTTVHLGCVAAGSMSAPSDEADVFNAIWTKIASKLNYKVNMVNGVVTTGELLTYYGKEPIGIKPDVTVANIIAGATYMIQDGEYITELPSLAREVVVADEGGFSHRSLLKYGDGTCGSWQRFAYNIFGSQGISVERMDIVRVGTLENTGNSGKIRILEMRVNPSLQGQGLVTPKENTWSNHAIFVYNNEIYDPSYGVAYGHKDSALSLFINNLHSIGYSENTPHDGYGWEYTPTKYPIDITPGDFVFALPFDSN
ncbi:MAG: hypothetical protein Q4G03_08770, partial [Planctomycetia bacterium]|nr:hypothetical protein [Planctomycetia bacterium]